VEVDIPNRNGHLGGGGANWHCGVDVAYLWLSMPTDSSTHSGRVHCLHEGWRRGSSQITLSFVVICLLLLIGASSCGHFSFLPHDAL